jgi:hypothetical protein
VQKAVRAFERDVPATTFRVGGEAKQSASELAPGCERREPKRSGQVLGNELSASQTLLDVAQRLHQTERRQVVLRESRGALAQALGQTQIAKNLEPAEHLKACLASGSALGSDGVEGHAPVAVRRRFERAIEDTEVLRADRPLGREEPIGLASEAERARRELLASVADPARPRSQTSSAQSSISPRREGGGAWLAQSTDRSSVPEIARPLTTTPLAETRTESPGTATIRFRIA